MSWIRKCVTWAVAGLALAAGLSRGVSAASRPLPSASAAAACPNPSPPPPSHSFKNTNVGLKPSLFKAYGRTHYFQLPSGKARGTLLVLPGCSRWGPGFWPYHPQECRECVGLTEDVAHTKQALARGYAILVAWPVDRAYPGQMCWSARDDGGTLPRILVDFLEAHGLRKQPVAVMGASSGGGVALKLQGMLDAQGVGVKLSGVLAEVATNLEVPDYAPRQKHHPPTAWVSMSYPNEIKKATARVADYKKYAPAAMVVSGVKKVTPTYFSDRHPRMTPVQSAELVAALKAVGVLAPGGTFTVDLQEDDRRWVKKLRDSLPWMNNRPAYVMGPVKKSAIWQAMKVAQAGHEHVCDYLTAALMWFEGGGKPSFEDLVAKYRVVKPAALTMARYDGEPVPAEAFAYDTSSTRRQLLENDDADDAEHSDYAEYADDAAEYVDDAADDAAEYVDDAVDDDEAGEDTETDTDNVFIAEEDLID
jgi:hypothetical protein